MTDTCTLLLGFPGGSVVKNPPANAGDTRDSGLIPGLERFPGAENANPLQYSCLENSMDREAWRATVQGVAERWTPLSPYTADSFRSSTLSGLTTDFSRAFLKNFKHSNF